MIAWFRKFVSRHLVADDPSPQYSRLDLADGVLQAPPSTPEELAETEARIGGDGHAA